MDYEPYRETLSQGKVSSQVTSESEAIETAKSDDTFSFFDELSEMISDASLEVSKEVSGLIKDLNQSLSSQDKDSTGDKNEGDNSNEDSEPNFFDDLDTIFKRISGQSNADSQSPTKTSLFEDNDDGDPDFFDDLKTIFKKILDDEVDDEQPLDKLDADDDQSETQDNAEPDFFSDLDAIFRKISSEKRSGIVDLFTTEANDALKTLSQDIAQAESLISDLGNEMNAGKVRRPPRKVIPLSEIFAICNTITQVNYDLKVTHIPKEGDIVEIKDPSVQKVTLVKELSSGGEGVVYTTNIDGQVAKIYKPNKVNSTTFEKLKLMCSKHIECEGICFPSSLLYNSHNEFVGFLMPQAHGHELLSSINKIRKGSFSEWKKADLVKLCISILEKINFLHDRNVILGDINPRNILVESPTKVYLVDADSYQVEGYPCQVAASDFSAPELHNRGKDYSQFLRTLGNENFSLAILLFEILMLGRHPYSIKGGDTTVANIRNADFAYIPSVHSQGKIPDGPWLFLWSHLSLDIKTSFYNTFNKNGSNHLEHLRMSSYEWLDVCKRYLTILENGKMEQQDPMSLDIMPTRCKLINQ